jgi:hypothetical protein
MKQLLTEIGLQILTPMPLWMDNQAAIMNIQQESSSSRLKHVDTQIKFLCDRASQIQVLPRYVKSEHMLADIFTKPLPQQWLCELKKMIGIEGGNECTPYRYAVSMSVCQSFKLFKAAKAMSQRKMQVLMTGEYFSISRRRILVRSLEQLAWLYIGILSHPHVV